MQNAVVIKELAGDFDNRADVWFSFEKSFPHPTVREWFQNNKHLSIYIGAAYILCTLLGERLMRKRERFELRGILLCWNILMATFSAFLALRIGPFFFRRLYHSTLYGAVCDGNYEDTIQIVMWLEIFVITKVVEFLDTVFIILRKQHLAFIHWYHHATVVMVCWYAEGSNRGPANCIYYVAMNSIVHSVMYTYYGLRAARIQVPKVVNMTITSMQIGQMIVGLLINMGAAYYMFLRPDRPCDDDPQQIFVAFSVYMSYFFLFCRFFYNTYLVRSKKPIAAALLNAVPCANRAGDNHIKKEL